MFVKIFDRRRQIARHHLACLMIKRITKGFIGVDLTAEFRVFDQRERVRDLRDFPAVFHDVLVYRGMHQRPSADIFHSAHIGVKIIIHYTTS